MKTAFILIVAWLGFAHAIAAQTSIAGRVINEDGIPVQNAKITLYENGIYVLKLRTDSYGNYSFSNIDPGTYQIIAEAEKCGPFHLQGLIAMAGKITKLDITLSAPSIDL